MKFYEKQMITKQGPVNMRRNEYEDESEQKEEEKGPTVDFRTVYPEERVTKRDSREESPMKLVSRMEGESLDALVRRCYTVRWIHGDEDPGRIDRAKKAVLDANPQFNKDRREVRLPRVPGIPYLRALIDNPQNLHHIIHEMLEMIQANPRLLALSFIDPIRLGCEELGITATPPVVEEIRKRLEADVSFDQERYEEIRDYGGSLHGITRIQWVPK